MRLTILFLSLFFVTNPTSQVLIHQSSKDALIAVTKAAIRAIDKNDIGRLASVIHPNWGICFAPDFSNHRNGMCLSRTNLDQIFSSRIKFQWGFGAGSGLPDIETFKEYLASKVKEFASEITQIRLRDKLEKRNTFDVNGLAKVYPPDENTAYVECYIPASKPNFNDWRGLWFVFERDSSKSKEWYLVAMINDDHGI